MQIFARAHLSIRMHPVYAVQLNEYETDPYFLQLSQNMSTNCLFTFVFSQFLPEFTCFAPIIVFF